MCCCCSLRTHTKVIAVICLISTVGGIGTIGAFMAETRDAVTIDAGFFQGGNMKGTLAIQIPIYVFCILSDVLCLVGAIKSKKCLLMPFIIKMVLLILASVIVATLFIIWGSKAGSFIAVSANDGDWQNVAGTVGTITSTIFYFLLIPLLIEVGIAIYFLVIVVRYFKEISSDMVTNSEPSSRSRTEFSTLRMDSIVTHAPVWRGGKYVCSESN